MYFKIILIALAAYVLILIAYPETRLWLKELIKKHPFLSSSLICLVLVIIAFLYFPPFFKYVALDFWKIPQTIYSDGTVEVVELADLGSIGDIFGSLNSFISSIALCAVALSTWLQVTSLKETRQANERQLKLAREAHDEQIKESKYSNFLNIYNSLMNYKLIKYNALQIRIDDGGDKKIWYAEEIFKEIALIFVGQKFVYNLSLSRIEIGDLYYEALNKIAGSDKGLGEINSYFLIYESLFELINRAEISTEDKVFFRKSISNSMSKHEQLTLLWASIEIKSLNNLVKNTGIFDQFHNQRLMPFLVKFYDKSCFSHREIIENWDRFANKQETPA